MKWIKNTLTVVGSKKDLLEFVLAARGYDREYGMNRVEFAALVSRYQKGRIHPSYQEFCFNALVPVPDEVLKAGFERAGYDWEIMNWGCRWGPSKIEVGELERISKYRPGWKIEYKFDTPDSPPLAFLGKVSGDYPGLKFKLKGVGLWRFGERRAFFRKKD